MTSIYKLYIIDIYVNKVIKTVYLENYKLDYFKN